jgi:hypothetical protein
MRERKERIIYSRVFLDGPIWSDGLYSNGLYTIQMK